MNLRFKIFTFVYFITVAGGDSTVSIAQDTGSIVNSTKSDSIQSEVKTINSVGESIQEVGQGIQWSVSVGKIFWSVILFLVAFFILKYAAC